MWQPQIGGAAAIVYQGFMRDGINRGRSDVICSFVLEHNLEGRPVFCVEKIAHVVFEPTLDQQRKCPECSESIVDGEFIIKYDVKREASAGDIQSSSDLTLAAETPVEEQDEAVKKHKYIFGEYIERLWAYLTIQQLLSKIVSAQPEEREALNEKALQLSLNYNFVTSLTSMVVTKPEEGQTDRTMVAHKPTEAEQGDRVDFTDENPRFVIPVKNKQRSVCFEIAAPSDGVILQLVSDADSGITINGELGEAGKSAFQKIGIVYKDLYEIEFNTQGLSLVNKTDHSIQTLSWSPMSIVSDRDFTVDYGTLSKDRVSCWVVPDGGRGAIEGSYSDYVVQTLFQKP
ncbi:UNVERIFIED_CONTAM: hypothetical protein FKN15_074858 [Acipenser sinensis]